MQDYLVSGKPASVDAGYKEPILTELSKKVGRKDETEEELPSENGWERPAEEVGREPKGEVKAETKPERTGGKHGSGLVAAAALLAIGAFALKEGGGSNTGTTASEVTLSPSPVVTGAGTVDDIGTYLEVGANVTVTPTGLLQPVISGSMLDGEFQPMEEEPYVPGQQTEELKQTEGEKEKDPVASLLTPIPETGDVIITDAMELYIVQNGDTLAEICREFYGDLTRMEEVKGINQIPDENWIYAGQELYLP